MPDKMLECRQLTKNFGGLTAVDALDFTVAEGELVGLIGPNGAGKTTVFNLLTGVHRLSAGSITFAGTDISHAETPDIARLGLVRTFQATRVLPEISVMQNVLVGFHCRLQSGLWSSILRTRTFREEEARIRDRAAAVLDMMGIGQWRDHDAGDIPQDAQRRLAIATALATDPRLMLLDEPTVGMNPSETAAMMRLIADIRAKGTTIILIEHDMKVVMDICERIVVLNYGRKIAEGSPQHIQNDQLVIEAYLGSEEYA